MSSEQKDTYFVAIKVFLKNKNDQLLIIKDIFGDGWDLPGGRLRKVDFNVPLEKVVQRKMREELGNKIKYRLEQPMVFFRHQRIELPPGGHGEKVRIFAIGYQASYISGEIILPTYIKKVTWVKLKNFNPRKYFNGGWLKGVQEYLDIRNKN